MILEKAYEHKNVEERWLSYWSVHDTFLVPAQLNRKRFSMVIPPPNITGALHTGHALQYTLHDLIIRWKRMRGYAALWVPGMDHAGIATQYVLEKELAKENLTKQQIGRDKFEERIWKWKESAIDKIKYQLMKLGSSCDWSRQRFTMDEGLSRAVAEVFVRLHQEGLVYRAETIINWCPRCLTALSDLETIHKESKGKLYYVRYPRKEGDGYIEVATTRPETILGDTAVAVNPGNTRFATLIGELVILPFLNRPIPVISDEAVDLLFGTGAVKITPAHDPDDFEIAKRHKLSAINIMTDDAVMNENAGPYKGLDRFACRNRILEDLKSEGLLFKEEDYEYAIGHCFRCDTVVEPRISTQWFIHMKPLAEPAIKAIEDKRVELIPENWNKVYYDWMHNIRDWCVSRQIWWGHRIPAFHCQQCSHITVAVVPPSQCEHCKSIHIVQDSDVLDTWFSSALWPFSVFGWPEHTQDLKNFYPTDLLITGYDILFFWVARMIMMGLKFMNDVPFRQVLLTGLIKDEHGQKMSRTKGNVIDPLEVIEEMGADALRFTLISQTAAGMDVSLARSKIFGSRTFVNKIWNASRFVLMNLPDNFTLHPLKEEDLSLFDKWILTRLNEVTREVNDNLHNYVLNNASHLIYHFIWNEYCDWYVEVSKPYLTGTDEHRKLTTLNVLVSILERILRILHPFMPFSTEELWSHLKTIVKEEKPLALVSYPLLKEEEIFMKSKESFAAIQDVVSRIRQIRSEMNIPPQKEVDCFVIPANNANWELFEYALPQITFLAKLSQFNKVASFPATKVLVKDSSLYAEIGVDVKGSVDFEKETARIAKEIAKLEKTIHEVTTKLNDKNILAKAPPEIVESFKERLSESELRMNRLKAHLHDLKG